MKKVIKISMALSILAATSLTRPVCQPWQMKPAGRQR
jgi:hypothetical protein